MSLGSSSSRFFRSATSKHRRVMLWHSRRQSSTTHDTSHEECDIVIVGGGPVGLALASALGSSHTVRENLRVTLVEAGSLAKVRNWALPPEKFSNRVSSLTNASQTFLKDIGAWSHVENERTSTIEEMQVWDGLSDARIVFAASQMGLDAPELGMARLTENLNLQRGLLRHLEQFPHIQLLDNIKVKSIVRDTEEHGGWPMVILDNDRVLRSRLLVGADGFNSPVRSYARIPSYGWEYDAQALVATMNHPPRGLFQGPNTTAYQRFLPTGPIAFLPLSPTTSSLVWSTKPQLASAILSSEPAVFASMINAAFRLPEISVRYLHDRILEAHSKGATLTHSEIQNEILWRERSHSLDQNSAYASAVIRTTDSVGVPPADSQSVPPLVTCIQAGTAASFPLRFSHAEYYIGEGAGSRTVLVGDAAHTIHPLAGQGLNLGIADVECLTRCIQDALLRGGDVGSYTALLRYAQERYLANHTLMSAVDKLHKLYSSTLDPVVWARSVGVEVLNELDSVKAAIIMAAGAHDNKVDTGAATWRLAANGVETLMAGANAAQSIRGAISGMVAAGLHELLKATAQQEQQK